MKNYTPLDGLRWSRNSDSALNNVPQTDVLGRAGGVRMLRGGGWFDIARCCRLSYRRSLPPDERYATLGFRLVLSE